jgi:CSLREA domain-containing protein
MNTRESSRRIVFILLQILVLVLFAAGLLFGPVGRVRSVGPYVVNTASDGPDSDVTDGICYSNVAFGCSLRAAIQQASHDGTTTITFLGTLAGQTLYLQNAYGQIVMDGNGTYLDGESNNIAISGYYLAAGQSVFQIQGNYNNIYNLTIRDAPQDGIQVGDFNYNGSGNNNIINYVMLIHNGASGVFVFGGSYGGGQHNSINNSLIGTSGWSSSTCNSGEANADGIYVASGTLTTTISSNRIVCNNGNGIYLYGASYVWVGGNKIGNNGVNAMPNAGNGVLIQGDNARHNLIGTDSLTYLRNVISGNGQDGVMLNGAPNNQIQANMIGSSSDGLSAIPNQLAGVAVVNHADGTWIGPGSVPLFISGNLREGIYVADSSNDWVSGLIMIGVKNNTASSPLGNGLEGIKLDSGVVNARIVPYFVKYNGGAGIAAVTKNEIEPIEAYGNGGLAIDLGNDGPTPNDAGGAGLGPDGWLDYPMITSQNGHLISGISCPGCTVYIRWPVGNPAANGGGYNGSIGYAVADWSTGVWSYQPFGFSAGQVTLTAQAPIGSGNGTSELSPLLAQLNKIYLPLVRRN